MAKTKDPDRDLAVTGVRIMVPGQRARRPGSRTNPPTELELVGALMCGQGFRGVRKLDRIRVGLSLAVEIANRSAYARRRMIEVLAVAYIIAASTASQPPSSGLGSSPCSAGQFRNSRPGRCSCGSQSGPKGSFGRSSAYCSCGPISVPARKRTSRSRIRTARYDRGPSSSHSNEPRRKHIAGARTRLILRIYLKKWWLIKQK